jgi:hypothetical protein
MVDWFVGNGRGMNDNDIVLHMMLNNWIIKLFVVVVVLARHYGCEFAHFGCTCTRLYETKKGLVLVDDLISVVLGVVIWFEDFLFYF